MYRISLIRSIVIIEVPYVGSSGTASLGQNARKVSILLSPFAELPQHLIHYYKGRSSSSTTPLAYLDGSQRYYASLGPAYSDAFRSTTLSRPPINPAREQQDEYTQEFVENLRISETGLCILRTNVFYGTPRRQAALRQITAVHRQLRLLEDTLFITIYNFNRFLARASIYSEDLRLRVVATLLLATKYEDSCYAYVEALVLARGKSFSAPELVAAERSILYTLDFRIRYPTPRPFIYYIGVANRYDPQLLEVAYYFAESTITVDCFLSFTPSLIAAGSYRAAQILLYKGYQTVFYTYYLGYTVQSLYIVVLAICRYYQEQSPNIVSRKHRRVSTYVHSRLTKILMVQKRRELGRRGVSLPQNNKEDFR